MKRNETPFEQAGYDRLFPKALVAVSIAFLGMTVTVDAAQGPQPSICTRACWGARAPTCGISQMGSLTRAIVHHTAGTGDYSTNLETSKARIRGVQNLHINNGWCDIAYHFLVDAGGNVFEGRSGAWSSLPRGTHDGCNNNSFGFTALGYYHPPYNQTFTGAQRSSMEAVIAWRMPSSWSPYGSGTYCSSNVGFMDGHYRVKATACPGDGIIGQLAGMRDGVNARKNPAPNYGQWAFNQPVSNQADGRLSVYAVGADTATWSSSMTAVNGPFGPWSSHAGGCKSGVVAARQPDGRQIIFVIGSNSQVYAQYQLSANGGWSAWQLIGGWVLSIAVAQNYDGRLQLFMVGTDQQVWTTAQTAANSNASFGGWSTFGENVQPGISVANHADGRIKFFMIGTDQHLYTWEQTAPNSGTWAREAWGGWILSVDVGRHSSGVLEVFMVGTDQQVWHIWQLAANANSWSGWASFGENVQPGISVATRAAGGLQFFLVGTDSQVYTWWLENGAWTRGTLWGIYVKPGVAVGINPDGRLSIFATGRDDGAVWTAWQNSGTGPFSGWASLGSAGGGIGSLFGSN